METTQTTEAAQHWAETYATDDIVALRAALADGEIDFDLFEMAS